MRIVDASRSLMEDLLSQPLRQGDVDEWFLGSGRGVRDNLLDPLSRGPVERALLDKGGRCLCLWGVVEGNLWLIATKAAMGKARALHRFWRQELARMHTHYSTLTACTSVRNVTHHRWLEAIGFERITTQAVAPFGARFHVYERKETPRRCVDHSPPS